MENEKEKSTSLFSPIEEFKKNGNFPWIMVIHFLLVILTTAQAILIIKSKTSYTRAQERIIYNLFIEKSPKNQIDFARYIYLYTVKDLKEHLNTSVHNFYNLKQNFLENVQYVDKKMEVIMELSYIDNTLIKKTVGGSIKREIFYTINNTTLGPFDKNDIDVKLFLNDVLEFKLNYRFQTFVPHFYHNNYDCIFWTITQLYSFTERAHFISKLNINRNSCLDLSNKLSLWENFILGLLWIHLVVMTLAVFSFISSWKYIYEMSIKYGKVRESRINNNEEAYHQIKENDNENSEIQKKKEKFDSWFVLCCISNVIQLFGAGISLFDSDNVLSSTEILVGFGCFLAYINIGRYLKFYPEYSTIFQTISRALPNVLRYLLGVVPIFFGFLFFGLCMFWRSERFSSPSNTMITLFAILNGDSVMDTFRDLSCFSFVFGQIYCYFFSIIFMVVVMNVFIAIIEEAYITIKMKDKNHWIYMYLKLDPKYVELKEDKTSKNNQLSSLHEPNRLSDTYRSILIMKESEKSNSMKGLDYFYNRIEEELIQIRKIIEDSNNSYNNQSIKDTLRYNFEKIEEIEKKISIIKNIN